jgi:hypothetical protein
MSDLVMSSARYATGGALDALAADFARTVRKPGERIAARRALVELSWLDDRTLKDVGYCRTNSWRSAYALRTGDLGRVRAMPADTCTDCSGG